MFTGHDGPATMNVYWSVAIFTSDWTSGQVGSFLPDIEKCKLRIQVDHHYSYHVMVHVHVLADCTGNVYIF